MSSQHPNVLFILTDQWRHDALGFRGHPLAVTPNLDRLAAGSTAFDNAFTPTPLCSPARGCLLTSHWPHRTGMQDNVGVGASRQAPLDPACRTWIEAARDAGFRVGYYGKWHLGEDGPIHRGAHGYSPGGFERGRPGPGAGAAMASETGELRPESKARYQTGGRRVRPGGRSPFYGTLEGSVRETGTGKTAEEAIGFLETPDPGPWFLTVSFSGPHFPHLVPEPFAGAVDPAQVPLPENLEESFAGKPWFQGRPWWPCHDTADLTCADWRRTAAAYYGMIAMIDSEIGRVLDAASAASDGRPTAVLFASDHGEMLGAHRRFDKGPYFYDEVMRIPLLIRPPEAGPRKGAQPNARPAGPVRRREFVTLLDLGATLFGLAGETAPGPGRDLLKRMRGRSRGAWPDETFGCYNAYNGHSFALRCIRTPDHKYCFNPQAADELYDLREDPGERRNLSSHPGFRSLAEGLRKRIFDWMHRQGDPLADRWRDLPAAGTFGCDPLG